MVAMVISEKFISSLKIFLKLAHGLVMGDLCSIQCTMNVSGVLTFAMFV